MGSNGLPKKFPDNTFARRYDLSGIPENRYAIASQIAHVRETEFAKELLDTIHHIAIIFDQAAVTKGFTIGQHPR